MGLAQKYVDGIKNRKGIPGVVRLLTNGIPGVANATRNILKNEGKLAIPTLFSVVEDPRTKPELGIAAAKLLMSLVDESHVDELIRLADSSNNPEVVEEVQPKIGELGSERAFAYLKEALLRNNPHERSRIAEIMGRTHNQQFIGPLTDALEHWYDYPNENDVGTALVHQGAATALARIGGPEVLPVILRHASKINSDLRTASAEMVFREVASIRISDALAICGRKQVDGLITSLKNDDPLIKTIIAIALGQIRNIIAVALLSISEMGHFLNRTLWHDQAALTRSLRFRL